MRIPHQVVARGRWSPLELGGAACANPPLIGIGLTGPLAQEGPSEIREVARAFNSQCTDTSADRGPARAVRSAHDDGTDHRSQVCTALTSLGVEPPDIDVWAYARESGRERLERAQD